MFALTMKSYAERDQQEQAQKDLNFLYAPKTKYVFLTSADVSLFVLNENTPNISLE